MRHLALAFLLLGISALAAEDKDAKALTPAEAAKKINEKCTVEMEVQSTGGQSNVYLNSKKDYRAADNFTVMIGREALDKFKAAKIDKPGEYYKGKTVRVTGTVKLFAEKPQIKVESPEQIKVVEKK